MRSILSLKIFPSLPGSRLRFFITMLFTPTINSTPLYNIMSKLYSQNPVFELVREESVKVYLHMYNGNVQQKLQCIESCVSNPVFEVVQASVKACTTRMSISTLYAQHRITENLHISLRFSPTIFYHDANSVRLLAHLDSMRGTLRSKLFVRRA